MASHRRASQGVLLLLLFAPSIVYLADYSVSALLPGPTRLSGSGSDAGWNLVMQESYPSYLITGEQIPVNLTLTLQLSEPYTSLRVDGLTAEVRDPNGINTTTNIIQTWTTLSFRAVPLGVNFTSPARISRVIYVAAVYPPSTGYLDPLVPTARIAVNGIVDFTLFSPEGSTSERVSLLDNQTVYVNQLSSMRSSASLLVYQLLTTLIASILFYRSRAVRAQPADAAYSRSLDAYRLTKSLAELDELMRARKIGQERYTELKKKYEEELAKVEAAK